MPKPACVTCKRFYRPLKNGVVVNEQMPNGGYSPAGTEQEEAWSPYKIWHADLWVCEGCGHQLISGYGREPEAIKHQPHFAQSLTRVTHTINDC